MASGPKRRLTWRATDVARGTASGCDAALRPRGRARVARTGSRSAVARPRGRRPRDNVGTRGRPCGAPRVSEERGDIRIVNRGIFSPI